jgi:hypothetical protein
MTTATAICVGATRRARHLPTPYKLSRSIKMRESRCRQCIKNPGGLRNFSDGRVLLEGNRIRIVDPDHRPKRLSLVRHLEALDDM